MQAAGEMLSGKAARLFFFAATPHTVHAQRTKGAHTSNSRRTNTYIFTLLFLHFLLDLFTSLYKTTR